MPEQTLTLQTTISRVDSAIFSRVGTEVMIMDIDRGRYYGLNTTGTQLWDLLAEPIQVGVLCDRLSAVFSIPTHQCESDILACVQDMVEHGLVKVMAEVTT